MPRRKTRKISSDEDDIVDDDDIPPKKPQKTTSRMSTRQNKRKLPPKPQVESSDDDEPVKPPPKKQAKPQKSNDSSSSESDIESYLQPINKLDLGSSFFESAVPKTTAAKKPLSSDSELDEPLKKPKVDLSSDSESEFKGFTAEDKKDVISTNGNAANFQNFIEYTQRMDEAKKHAALYQTKQDEKLKAQDSDILNMLASSEPSLIAENKKLLEQTLHSSDFDSCSDSEKEDWEEIKAADKPEKQSKQSIEITVDMPTVIKKKKGTDILMAMKRRFNRIKKENQVYVHKVHLLGWIAHGNYVNSTLSIPHILGRALSILPGDKCFTDKETDSKYLQQIVNWYTKAVVNVKREIPANLPLEQLLKQQIKKKEVYDAKMLVLVFVCVLRAMGMQCRLVMSLQPLPLRPPASELCSLSTNSGEKLREAAEKKKKEAMEKALKQESAKKQTKKKETKKKVEKHVEKRAEAKKQPSRKASPNKTESTRSTRSKSRKSEAAPSSPSKLKSPASKYFSTPPSTSKGLDVRNDIVNLLKGQIKQHKEADKRRSQRARRSTKPKPEDDSGEDSDYVPEAPPAKKQTADSSDEDNFMPKTKVKQRVAPKSKQLAAKSSPVKKVKYGTDVWVEVFLQKEDKWISVDLQKAQINCVKELYAKATHPVAYILAWNNSNAVKDLTKRYCENFNTITRKLRVDAKWWDDTLRPYVGVATIQDRVEDCDMDRQQQDQPLPKSITEYKNHPLYVLKRHLLKFEAIYPPDIAPLGFVRNEPVYPRSSVYVCRSRDIWLKHAKVVKLGEQPYKIVKARPKYDKLSNKVVSDQMLEIFGPWQTQDYEPPTAENGIVPRNEFGNVDLFKECMLPKKTVHLKLPGLNKVAKKLNIDCASAIVGFDFHGGWSHPTYDGFVVCEEFKDTLIDAWNAEQQEIEKRENEKIDKRVYGNWKKLIKGLLIKQRLNARYEFGGEGSKKEGTKKKSGKK